MNILGIDLGTTQSGICLLDPETGQVSAKGVLTVKETRKFIKKNRAKIQMIAVELPVIYTRMMPGSNITLGIMLRECGRIEECGALLKIPVVLITRADVCKVLTGRRPCKGTKVTKADTQEALRLTLGLEQPIRPQHSSDAGCVAYAAWRLTQEVAA